MSVMEWRKHLKKILNGTVGLDSKHRIVIVLPPCWQYIANKLSKEIEAFSVKYMFKITDEMDEKELDEKERFDSNCDLLTELYQPFYDAIRRQTVSAKKVSGINRA